MAESGVVPPPPERRGMELGHEDLTSIGAFMAALEKATSDTGVSIDHDYLWMDGEIVGAIEPNEGGGYWFKVSAGG